jgi:hypothetical protein
VEGEDQSDTVHYADPLALIQRHARRNRDGSACQRPSAVRASLPLRLVALWREGPNSRARKSHHDMARHPVERIQRQARRRRESSGVRRWPPASAPAEVRVLPSVAGPSIGDAASVWLTDS